MAGANLVAVAQAEVFVSYSSRDEGAVKSIVMALEAAGVTVWRDGDHILGGQYYGEKISHAIAHSRVVLLMCSPNAFASDNVHREVLLTWDYYHRTFLPIWLTPPEEIPHRFRYCLVGCQQVMAHEARDSHVSQILTALEGLAVSTSRCPETAMAPPRPAPCEDRRGPRFKPGDRPLPGVDWQLVELLGKGGFGEVWKAVNPDLPSQPPVALKFALNLDATAKHILRHEAEIILRVQQVVGSNGVVPLLHAYLSNDPPCLEYSFYEGTTLARLIDSRRAASALTPKQVQLIVERIARIVGEFHRAQPSVVHCDLKPSNILVKLRGEGRISLKVTDFGIGRIASELSMQRSRSGSSLDGCMSAVLTGAHTPLYASPQQMRSNRPEPTDDVYSLGVIWYQLVIGDITAPAPTGRKWMEALRAQGVHANAIELLAACLEADGADRPRDAQCMAEELARSGQAATELERAIEATIVECEILQVAANALQTSPLIVETVAASVSDTRPVSSPAAPSPQVLDVRQIMSREAALSKVRGPAILLMVWGALYGVGGVLTVFLSLSGWSMPQDLPPIVLTVSGLLTTAAGAFIVYCGLRMKALEWYILVMVGVVVGMAIGFPCWSAPGIWPLVVLLGHGVKSNFDAQGKLMRP